MAKHGGGRGAKGGNKKTAGKSKSKDKVNPFDRVKQRSKHSVLNRKQKGTERRQGQARSRAIEKRKESLLVEFQQTTKNKEGRFVDKRFGENFGGDTSLSKEDKALKRFQRERMNQASQFSLEDNDSVETLTHFGQTLSTKNMGDSVPRDFSDDDEDGRIDQDDLDNLIRRKTTVKAPKFEFASEFGTANPNRARSQKEVMHEVMMKSKYFKMQDQEQRSQERTEIDILDTDYKDIHKLLQFRNKNGPMTDAELAASELANKADEYDIETRKLQFEMKAEATDRTKTDEERAAENREKLEKLEKERIQRMKGISSNAKSGKHTTGDSLAGDFQIDEEFAVQSSDDDSEAELVGDQSWANLSDDDDNDSNMSDQDGQEEDEEDSDDDSDAFDLGNDDDEEREGLTSDEEEDNTTSAKTRKSSQAADEAAKHDNIPFIIDAPDSYEDFVATLDQFKATPAQTAVVIGRIRASNHIKLKAENKPKMQRFFGIVLDHLRNVCECTDEPQLDELDGLSRSLFALTQDMPNISAGAFRQAVSRIQTKIMRRWARNKLDRSGMPDAHDLLFLRVLTQCFPVSDFRHHVATPALLLLCQCLSQCPIRGGRDMAAGLFISELMLFYIADSKRIIPELVFWLRGALETGFSKPTTTTQQSQLVASSQFITFRPGSEIWHGAFSKTSPSSSSTATKLNLAALWQESNQRKLFSTPDFHAASLNVLLSHISRLAALYSQVPSFTELFEPLAIALGTLKSKHWPQSCRERKTQLVEQIADASQKFIAKRKPLFQKMKPATIKQLTPLVVDHFRPEMMMSANKDESELKKLKRKLKSEKKGAMREIRKDTAFIAQERRRQDDRARQIHDKKRRRDMTLIQQQAADTNPFRMKGRKEAAEDSS